MSSTAYKIFVMQASEARQKIEYHVFGQSNNLWYNVHYTDDWMWGKYNYRIKLPEGWEYVIENNEIAFRKLRDYDYYLNKQYKIRQYNFGSPKLTCKVPIIKKIEG
jgi:hypothetical protein